MTAGAEVWRAPRVVGWRAGVGGCTSGAGIGGGTGGGMEGGVGWTGGGTVSTAAADSSRLEPTRLTRPPLPRPPTRADSSRFDRHYRRRRRRRSRCNSRRQLCSHHLRCDLLSFVYPDRLGRFHLPPSATLVHQCSANHVRVHAFNMTTCSWRRRVPERAGRRPDHQHAALRAVVGMTTNAFKRFRSWNGPSINVLARVHIQRSSLSGLGGALKHGSRRSKLW